MLSAVLYPYVYLSARASFVQQSVCVLEVARTLGQTAGGTFWRVALPLARPALAAGLALALMETLNDLGAVQYLGVQTLTASIYTTWLQRSSLGGAAQMALVALLFVLVLVAGSNARPAAGARPITPPGAIARFPSRIWRDGAACRRRRLRAAVLAGFVLPFAILLVQASRTSPMRWRRASGARSRNSIGVSARGGDCDGGAGSALATRGAWHPTGSCALRFAVRASAMPCPERCWRSAC